MPILDFWKRKRVYLTSAHTCLADFYEERQVFSRAVWISCVEKISRLCNDVTFEYISGSRVAFAEFDKFFQNDGERVLNELYSKGFVVLAKNTFGFEILKAKDFTKTTEDGDVYLTTKKDNTYLIKSETFEAEGMSDRAICRPFLTFIDNVLNASNTCSARLGALVVASPTQSSGAPTATVLTNEQREELEKYMQKEYGSLRDQKQIMLLPRAMSFQTISLAAIDAKTKDKVMMALSFIADKLDIPANQITLFDTNSGKSLQNGGEMREGDFLRYATFERLLNRTFVKLANQLGLEVNYSIYNKPERESEISNLSSELLGVLSTNEKREALGYPKEIGQSDTMLAQTLGVGGTQSFVEIVQSETISNEEKRGLLKTLFGLTDTEVDQVVPTEPTQENYNDLWKQDK